MHIEDVEIGDILVQVVPYEAYVRVLDKCGETLMVRAEMGLEMLARAERFDHKISPAQAREFELCPWVRVDGYDGTNDDLED